MELRSRSRSKTPFLQKSSEDEVTQESAGHVTVTRNTRRSAFVTSSTEVTSSSSEQAYTTSRRLRSSSHRLEHAQHKTSDYSSEEGESEVKQISENQKNQIIEDAKRAANGSTEISALNLYLKSGRYWDKYPKTDYTYSPHSRDRVEIAPGVVQMPNMSRRTIHSQDISTNTEDSWLTSYGLKQRLFRNNNSEYKISHTTETRTFVSRITTIIVTIFQTVIWAFWSVYEVQNSGVVKLGKKLHRLASWLMLVDTWLLRKSRSGGSKVSRVVVLCLLPLLLFAGWWLLSTTGSAIYGALSSSKSPPVTVVPPVAVLPTENNHQIHNLDDDELVARILQHRNMQNVINNYNYMASSSNNDNGNDEKLVLLIDNLKKEIDRIKLDLRSSEQLHKDDLDDLMMRLRSEYSQSLSRLTLEMRKCCRKPVFIDIERHVSAILTRLLNDGEFLTRQNGFKQYLHSIFVAKSHLEDKLANLTMKNFENVQVNVGSTADKVMDEVVGRLSRQFEGGEISDRRVTEIVNAALRVYDADKTGLVDYAMEPMGGQVLTTRCTEHYNTGTAVVSVLGIPLWYPTNSPRTVITPGMNPGECWAFQNFPGFLVVKLAARVKIEAFSLEHISRLLVPDGKIDSAPKDFQVYGLITENDKDPVLIGEYTYDYDGESVQYFTAQNFGLAFENIELRLKSNHGNPNYTCLYRFRVHGTVSRDGTDT